MNKHFIYIASIFSLFSCGGGTSDSSNSGNLNPPISSPPVSQNDVTPLFIQDDMRFYGKTEARAGETIGFALIHENDEAFDVSWTQIDGPPLPILAANSQSIGITPDTSGNYTIGATITKSNGERQNIETSFTVSERAEISIMLDHTAAEMAKVSLHINNRSGRNVSAISWEQTAGVEIAELTEQGQFLFFNAPEVSKDELLELRAQVTLETGNTYSEEVFVLVQNVDINRDGLFFGNNDDVITEDMHAYLPSSPYKTAIESCVYGNRIPNPPNCSFATLPLIGMVTPNPDINDILERTLVSHQWMGDRFRQYLQDSVAGPDMLNLLRGVTAIVISYEVRPSFYWAATGAIYLDANNFWMTPSERDTLNDQPDFRSNFGNELQFLFPWRYVKNNDYYPATFYGNKDLRQTRSFEDVEAEISWLMYHELAHANDFFPPTAWQNINDNTTPLAYFRGNGTNSDVLNNNFPLRSDEMHALAQVSFGGEDATATQKAYTAEDVASFFEPDISPSYYSFFTTREDYATLFERFIMLHRLGAGADVAILSDVDNDQRLITWGQRNRVSDPALADRVEFAVSRVYPELVNVRALIQQLPEEQTLPSGVSWFDAVDLSQTGNSVQEVNKMSKAEKHRRMELDTRRPHHMN
ncbi:hypothetical protein [Agaribacter flavus]|uniref:Lipoprotein n=1 Tax=Agaribacter flavus TaxID=1902781 RepID=A0ABV7FNA1_9ALTE